MTLRARPTAGRSRRSSHDNEARQKLYVTIGFIAVIVIAVGILAGSVVVSWYNDHLKPVATVDGSAITRDQWLERTKIELFRIGEGEKRVRESLAAGQVGQDIASQQLELLDQQRQQVTQGALEGLIDALVIEKYAAAEGVSASDADLEAALKKESSQPELRQTLAIFVRPDVDAGADFPSQAQRDAGKAKAEQALAELKAGKDFVAVAKQYSNDASKEQGGDFGSLADTNPTDRAWVKAVFALPLDGTTEVIEGADGTFRIGRVTEITPAKEDAAFRAAVEQGPGLEAYKTYLTAQVLQEKITEKLVALATAGPVEQVHAYEILIDKGSGDAGGQEVRASHILYSPQDDPGGASALPTDDPAWADSQQQADAAAAKLRAIADVAEREAEFATLAKAESDDTGSGATGGDLGWFTRGAMVQEFADAIFEGTHGKGDIVGPVKSQFGWHVILFDRFRPAPKQRAAELLVKVNEPGADFAAIAKEESDGLEAAKGGDLGWIAPGQSSDPTIEEALFTLQAGQIGEGLELGDGFHIYKVVGRETRPLDPEQINRIQLNAFTLWFAPKKGAAVITRDDAALGSGL